MYVQRERAKAPSNKPAAPEVDDDAAAEGEGPDDKIREGADAAQPTSGDEVGPGGWVKRKVITPKPKPAGVLGTSLSVFRMKPQREQKEFQVLAFPNTTELTSEERAARRKITSVQVIQ